MKKVFLIFWCCALGSSVWAQIPGMGGRGSFPTGGGAGGGRAQIDDSTKQIYGPSTTRFFLEDDVFNNRKTLYNIDTSFRDAHVYNYVQRAQNQLVDLGNLGTAIRPLFFQPVEQLGAQFGYNVYSPYAYPIKDVKFYDTKSPFTNMYLVLGGNGQNILRFDHSQSLSPRLNLGFNAQRMTSEKQFGSSSNSGTSNGLVANWAFVFHGNYRSENEKYALLAQFNHLNHFVNEQGGILGDSTAFKIPVVFPQLWIVRNSDGTYNLSDPDRQVSYFNDANRPALLQTASSWERRSHWHLYQQYVMAQGFQLYHVFDLRYDKNYFNHGNLAEARASNFYRNYFYNKLQTDQQLRFSLVENKVGIKGRYKDFNYRAHFRNRIVGMNGSYNFAGRSFPQLLIVRQTDGSYNLSDSTGGGYKANRVENFVGLWLNYYLKDSTQRLTAEFEYLLGRDFRLKGELVSKWFTAGYESVFSSPTLLQQVYASNHLRWDNNFGFMNSNTLFGQVNFSTKKVKLVPRLDYHLLNNFIYYDTLAQPRQELTPFSVFRLSGLAEWKPSKRWQFQTQLNYTAVANKNVLRIPAFSGSFRGSFDFVYSKALEVQVGIDLHYKSAYFADAYMPLTQQFYRQNRFQTEDYLLAEAFANFRINRVRLFVKAAHANQGILAPGYFQTPFYPVVGRSIGFGVNWPLFD